jgi:hypothetical protein
MDTYFINCYETNFLRIFTQKEPVAQLHDFPTTNYNFNIGTLSLPVPFKDPIHDEYRWITVLSLRSDVKRFAAVIK